MQLTKLNADSSWMFYFDGLHVLVDPWFTPAQVDFHPWFSRQFHLDPQPQLSEIQSPDFIFISHRYTDHCNRETLLQFSSDIPVIAIPSILKKIAKWGHFQTLLPLSSAPFHVEVLKTKNALVHKAYLFESSQNKIVFAPHGAVLKNIPNVKIDAVISTTLCYQLPFFLGGTINLGQESAVRLQQQLRANLLLTTHNEDKKGEGLVSFFAKRKLSESSAFLELKPGQVFDLAAHN